jgi:hypothetical protein
MFSQIRQTTENNPTTTTSSNAQNYSRQAVAYSGYPNYSCPSATSYSAYPYYYNYPTSNCFSAREETVKCDVVNQNKENEKEKVETSSEKQDIPTPHATDLSLIPYPTYFTHQKSNINQSKLSYTNFQKKLLESAYKTMKYPNSDQKTALSEKLGITRDQLKIWFQNRRRRDVLVKNNPLNDLKRSSENNSLKRSRNSDNDDDYENYDEENSFENFAFCISSSSLSSSSPEQQPPMKSQKQRASLTQEELNESKCIENVLNELKSMKNGPSRLVKKAKTSHNSSSSSSPTTNIKTTTLNPTNVESDFTLKNSFTDLTTASTYSSSSSSGLSFSSSDDDQKFNTAYNFLQPNSSKILHESSQFNIVKQPISLNQYLSNKQLQLQQQQQVTSSISKYPTIHNLKNYNSTQQQTQNYFQNYNNNYQQQHASTSVDNTQKPSYFNAYNNTQLSNQSSANMSFYYGNMKAYYQNQYDQQQQHSQTYYHH